MVDVQGDGRRLMMTGGATTTRGATGYTGAGTT